MLGTIIEFLSGKKTTIATIIGALVVFSLGRGYIAQDVANLISAIMIALGFSMNALTAMYYNQE